MTHAMLFAIQVQEREREREREKCVSNDAFKMTDAIGYKVRLACDLDGFKLTINQAWGREREREREREGVEFD